MSAFIGCAHFAPFDATYCGDCVDEMIKENALLQAKVRAAVKILEMIYLEHQYPVIQETLAELRK